MAQRLGSRSYYTYTSDSGDDYNLLLDDTMATLPGTGLVLEAANSDSSPPPRRFKPRGVFWESNTQGLSSKFIVCGTVGSTLYSQNSSTSVTIDGEAGRTTGRKGEKVSYGGNPPTTTPTP